MNTLPYNPPVRKYDFRGVLSIVDQQGKVVLEIVPQSRDIAYEKRLATLIQLLIDLLNGKRKIEFNPDNGSYELWDLIPPPAPLPSASEVNHLTDPATVPKKRGRPVKAK